MNIEIKTAVEGCARYCPKFQIVAQILFSNNGIYKRAYRCEHLEECKAMLGALDTVTVEMENIT